MRALSLKYLNFFPLILLCIFFTIKLLDYPIHDFSNYYFSGKILWDGHFTTDIYFPEWFNEKIEATGQENMYVSFAPNTPFLALFYSVFSLIPVLTAKIILSIISCFFFIFSLIRLFKRLQISPLYALLIPVIFFSPLKNNILFGQTYFIVIGLLIEGWLAYGKDKKVWTGFFWSLAILLKIFPVFIILFLIWKKDFKTLLYLSAFSLSLFGFSLFFVEWEVWEFFFLQIMPKASAGEIANSFVSNYQSFEMFFKTAFVFDLFENPSPLLDCYKCYSWLIISSKAMILIGFWLFARKNKNDYYNFSAGLLLSILISAYGSTYSLLILIFVFLSIINSSKIKNEIKILLLAILFIINNVPVHLFADFAFPLNYIRLLFLVGFLFILGFYTIPKKNWKYILSVLFIGGLTFILPEKEKISSEKLINNPKALLVSDYDLKNGKINYNYRTQEGKVTEALNFDGTDFKPLLLKDNMVFYNGKPVTEGKSFKKKPFLIDGRWILYLSDEDRGIGFYTLRKIDCVQK